MRQLSIFPEREICRKRVLSTSDFISEVLNFSVFGTRTVIEEFPDVSVHIPVYINEFWTSKQRAGHSLHEISYRACFKADLPRFFIQRLSDQGHFIYDPFMGRGTTLLEAALSGRIPVGCDINPLSRILLRPRLEPPSLSDIQARLRSVDLDRTTDIAEDLLVFYHRQTLNAITNLRSYFINKQATGTMDSVDHWIRMVATNRLTGHSAGFFSVYTMPPNQAVSVASQRKINVDRQLVPPPRDVCQIILKKSRSLMRDVTTSDIECLYNVAGRTLLLTSSSDETPGIPDNTIHLVVTSPPFLNAVDYRTDNWLRCWFNNIDIDRIQLWQSSNPAEWRKSMQSVLSELNRVLVPGGYVAFEVGEVHSGKLLLETLVVPAARSAGLDPIMVIINAQKFTKTSNCWGIHNQKKGTNTNRIVLLRKNC